MDDELPRLIEVGATGVPRTFVLRHGTSTIGRGHGRDVSLDHPSISRLHATMERTPDGLFLADQDSRNGTFLDGVAVTGRVPVRHGQRLRFGQVTLELARPPALELSPAASRAVISVDSKSPDDTMLDSAIAAYRDSADGVREDRRFELLRAMAAVFGSSRSPKELREVILSHVPKLLGADRALLIEFDGAGPPQVQAMPPEHVANGYSQHVVDWVTSRREASLFQDAPTDLRLEHAPSIMESAIQCVLAAPLLVDDEVLGVLYVDDASHGLALSELDLDVMVVLASQAALALKTARLQRMRHTYERYFPPSVTEQLLNESVKPDESVPVVVTALFADLCDYSGLCQRMSPPELVALLNEFLPPMARIVFERQGMLEKYIGDALLAAWGAPVARDDDAARAVDAARAMQAEAARLGLEVHIGLHTGPVAFTHLGTDDFFQLALIGDATTLASRVCGAAGSGEIVITEATRQALGPGTDVSLSAMGDHRLKGRRSPVRLFRVEPTA